VLCKVSGKGKQISSFNLVHGYSRDGFLVILLGLLMLLIVLIGRNQGIRTMFSLILAGAVIYFIMMPLITKGKNPVLATTLTCAIIASSSLLIIVGPKRKTYSAILGTISGVIIASIIVIYAQERLHFSGLENAIAVDIIEATGEQLFDFKKLLLAGMLMGVLGVAMDGAIEVASSMEEIRRANPRIETAKLIGAGMTVGTDVLGTMVNTLLFAYFGLRLLLMLTVMSPDTELFVSPLGELLSVGVISAEIVRLLAGTIGVVITIPITALISGFLQTKRRSNARY